MATPSARFFTRRSISAPVIALLGFTLVLAAQHVLQASRSVPQKAAALAQPATASYQTITPIFDTHVVARDDLIFAGADAPTAGERGLRQRLTRIYYLAQSPYELTWALDSDALSCTPHAAQAFLSDALENRLWDFSIAHASQRLGREERMYPHSGNIVFRWREETSALLRDWFMLQLRQGVASDDEKSLHLAELRLSRRYGTSKFKIGRITPELGARLYTVAETANGITPVLHGPVAPSRRSAQPSTATPTALAKSCTRRRAATSHSQRSQSAWPRSGSP